MRCLLVLAGLAGLAGLVGPVGLVGCATAGLDDPTDASPTTDGPLPIDAPVVDALIMRTLSQTSDMTVATGATIACSSQTSPLTRDNSWYRVFPLAAAGIAGAFHVSQVVFGVELAGPATQSIEVRLGTYAGTPGLQLDTAMITVLETATVSVPASTAPQLLIAPMTRTIPAGSQIIVELAAPDGQAQTLEFYAGSTAGTETAPGYLRSTACTVPQPRSIKALDATAGAVIIEVAGSY